MMVCDSGSDRSMEAKRSGMSEVIYALTRRSASGVGGKRSQRQIFTYAKPVINLGYILRRNRCVVKLSVGGVISMDGGKNGTELALSTDIYSA